MHAVEVHRCSICGEEKSAGQIWFLVVESRCDDRCKVLRWDDELSQRPGVHAVCCPRHVQELVIQWMIRGGFDYPSPDLFGTQQPLSRQFGLLLSIREDVNLPKIPQICELAVDRESLKRALNDHPEALQLILDELFNSLTRETSGGVTRLDSVDVSSPLYPRVV